MDPRGLGSECSGPTWPWRQTLVTSLLTAAWGAPTVLSPGNPEGAFVSVPLVPVMGAW